MEHNTTPLTSDGERHWWWISSILAAGSFLLSYVAFAIIDASGRAWITDALYQSAQVLLLHAPVPELLESGESPVATLLLHFAMPLAVLAWASTSIALVMEFFGKRLRMFYTVRRGGHTVICGLGGVGRRLLREESSARHRIVVIDSGPNSAAAALAAHSRASVICGSVVNPEMLRSAGIGKARTLYAATDDDIVNLACVEQARQVAQVPGRPSGLHAFIHISDPHLRIQLRQHRAFRSEDGKSRATIISVFENKARLLLRDYPLDHRRIRPNDPDVVQLVIVGFGLAGEAILTRAALLGHYANLQPLKALVIDRDATRKEKLFHSRYPRFCHVAKAEFLQLDAEDPDTQTRLANWLSAPNTISSVVVAISDAQRALSIALSLQAGLQGRVPLRLLVDDESEIGELLGGAGLGGALQAQITLIGSIPNSGMPANWIGGDLDIIAKALHEDYVGRLPETERVAPQMRNNYPWKRLDDEFIDSTRQQADHIPVKLRAIGCAMFARENPRLGEIVQEFTVDEIELLAKMEHRRWMAERWIAGWSLGPKNFDQRISPSLVEWDQLPSNIQDYDRNFVRILPAVLKLIGREIRR